MKLSSQFSTVLLVSLWFTSLNAEEFITKWDAAIPERITEESPHVTSVNPVPIDFEVLITRTTRKNVFEAPEMPGLPPVNGTINATVQLVKDPKLPAVQPLPTSSPANPEVIERMAEVDEKYLCTQMVSVSATVYDRKRTLLRISPNGKSDNTVTAWSNLDFNHFSDVTTYQVKDGVDGTIYEYLLMMDIGNASAEEEKKIAELNKLSDERTRIPNLPDLYEGGPAFVLLSGNEECSALDTLEQIHDLYRNEGVKMENAYYARVKADTERKAYLLANPQKPKDVTIRVWSRTSSGSQHNVAR